MKNYVWNKLVMKNCSSQGKQKYQNISPNYAYEKIGKTINNKSKEENLNEKSDDERRKGKSWLEISINCNKL